MRTAGSNRQNVWCVVDEFGRVVEDGFGRLVCFPVRSEARLFSYQHFDYKVVKKVWYY